ncbi:pseudouridine synthase [Rhizobiales bacterium]|uniref:pseudouridine synthase n=1 Tax=Hongsoonwoonella zoysiae TaxID=2821844 RepID=UPI0015601106|nr:pseudouridine synthase [Hongsoonwoonella zoysiae]NRG18141.1 pseudouridine synthase [Hongsoonwoonella zoysiae]
MKLVRHIANLGYGSRKDVQRLIRQKRVTDSAGRPLSDHELIAHDEIRIDGEPLDPPQGSVILLNKPVGYTCSAADQGHIVYDLLPDRFRHRKPTMSTVGRLDRDTSGLLLLTDDGTLLHKIISPKSHVPKVYEVTLARPLEGNEGDVFASGSLMLKSEKTPLLPAELEVTGEKSARLTLREGRYHQIRRMFAAVGNHVEALHRSKVGNLTLDGLEEGHWRLCDESDIEKLLPS